MKIICSQCGKEISVDSINAASKLVFCESSNEELWASGIFDKRHTD